jgi:hypothetical protein
MKCAGGDCAGAPTPLVSRRVSARTVSFPVFLLHEMDVYWSDATGNVQDVESSEQLFRCSINGCANGPESMVVGPVLAAAVDTINLYWTTGSREIDYRPLVDSAADAAVSLEFFSKALPDAISGLLVADDTEIYWVLEDHRILKCPKIGCNDMPVVVKASTEDLPVQMALGADALYYLAWIPATNGWEVRSCAKVGCGNQSSIIANGLAAPVGIATDGVNVYWTEHGSTDQAGLVRKCPADGCNNQPTIVATDLTSPGAIVVDSQSVYWVESGIAGMANGRIWKAPK